MIRFMSKIAVWSVLSGSLYAEDFTMLMLPGDAGIWPHEPPVITLRNPLETGVGPLRVTS